MKIHIYYRHYNVEGTGYNRPEWFDYEKCYDNLLNSLKDVSDDLYNINIVFDGDVTTNWISNKQSTRVHQIQASTDMKSFFKTCDIIKQDTNIDEDDLIYFLENDYMHVPNWLPIIFELYSMYTGLNYVSLYDHYDKYYLPMYDELTSKLFVTKTRHWRSTPSTCGSFIINKQTFDADYDILSTMNGDHEKYLWLNANRDRSVITPIPGLSTHCMANLLSPTIEWDKL